MIFLYNYDFSALRGLVKHNSKVYNIDIKKACISGSHAFPFRGSYSFTVELVPFSGGNSF